MLLHHHQFVSAAHFLLPGCCHRSLYGGNKGFSPILLFSARPAIFAHATIFTHPTVFTLPAIFTQYNIFTHFFFQSFNFRIIFGSFVFIPQMSSQVTSLFVHTPWMKTFSGQISAFECRQVTNQFLETFQMQASYHCKPCTEESSEKTTHLTQDQIG